MKRFFSILSFFSAVFLLSGCSSGLTSHKPILGKNQSDPIEGVAGYWSVKSVTAGLKQIPLDSPEVWSVEDYSTGLPFFKDSVYRVRSLAVRSLAESLKPSNFSEMRARKAQDGFVLQGCGQDDKEKVVCFFAYLFRETGKIRLRFLYDADLNAETKEVLGPIYITASDRNDLELPDDFVDRYGMKLIDAIARGPLPPLSENSGVSVILTKVSTAEAATLIDEAKRLAAEKKQKEAKEKQEKAAAEQAAARAKAAAGPRPLEVTNRCAYAVKLAIQYRKPDGTWSTNGWWNLDAGQTRSLTFSDGTSAVTKESFLWYFAESTNGSAVWQGDHPVTFDGRNLLMRRMDYNQGTFSWALTCNAK